MRRFVVWTKPVSIKSLISFSVDVYKRQVQNAEEARLLEANYSISSKQYVENGIHMKILSKEKPNEKCVPDNDITLEDAYIYLTNS